MKIKIAITFEHSLSGEDLDKLNAMPKHMQDVALDVWVEEAKRGIAGNLHQFDDVANLQVAAHIERDADE